MKPQYQRLGEENLRLIGNIAAQKDAANTARKRELSEIQAVNKECNEMLQQCDEAITESCNALKERDNVIASLGSKGTINCGLGCGSSRMQEATNQLSGQSRLSVSFPAQATTSQGAHKVHEAKQAKQNCLKSPQVVRKMSGLDLNRPATDTESDSEDFDMTDEFKIDLLTMPKPVCSCTGIPRRCYKWGSGGWQSACCTTKLSEYPLPRVENKGCLRMRGRKMSKSVFSKVLKCAAEQGHDLRTPLDLKEYWTKHGTNRFRTLR